MRITTTELALNVESLILTDLAVLHHSRKQPARSYPRLANSPVINNPQSYTAIKQLPAEIILDIMRLCNDNVTLLNCRLVSKHMEQLASSLLFNTPKMHTLKQIRKLCRMASSPASVIPSYFRYLDFSKRTQLVSGEHLRVLVSGSRLHTLNLSKSCVSHTDLFDILLTVQGVRHLNLDHCDVTDALLIECLPKYEHLKSISLHECRNITGLSFTAMSQCTRLQSISISFAKQITGSLFRQAYSNSKGSILLKSLHIKSCGRWEDVDVEFMTREMLCLKSLRLVHNSGTISKQAVYAILERMIVEELVIARTKVMHLGQLMDSRHPTAAIMPLEELQKLHETFPHVKIKI